METIENIKSDATNVIKHVIQEYITKHDASEVLGIACECDPSVSSLYIHLATISDDINEDPIGWTHSFYEQKCTLSSEPKWFQEFNKMNQDYFNSDADESEYIHIENYFEKILDGVSNAIANCEEWLIRKGFNQNLTLSLSTEDDDDIEQGYKRINKYKNR